MNKALKQTELIFPDSRKLSAGTCAAGYLCRSLLAFICVFGFAVFIDDSLLLDTGVPVQFAVSLICCAYFAVMGISKRFFIGGALIGVALFALNVYITGPEKYLYKVVYAIMAVSNSFCRRLVELGYNGMSNHIVDFSNILRNDHISEGECRVFALTIIITVLSAVICACLQKRVHILPLITVGGIICTVSLYYGMSAHNYGFALITAALCGCIAQSGYDRIYANKKNISANLGLLPGTKASRDEVRKSFRSNSASGGFTGLTSALLALLLLLGPANTAQSMKDIPAISTPAYKLENYFISLANGENPDFSSLIFSGVSSIDSRDTETSKRVYNGDPVFEVRLDTPIPVYLRNWVGMDYYGDRWHSAAYDKIDEYRRLFGEDFSPEQLTIDILTALNPSLTGLASNSGYKNRTELGYVTAAVNIKKLKPTSNLLFLPSYSYNSTGLLDYGTREPSSVRYTDYFDGIYTSTPYLFMDNYTTVANLPLLRDPEFAGNLTYLWNYYLSQEDIITSVKLAAFDGADEAEIAEIYNDAVDRNSGNYGAFKIFRPVVTTDDTVELYNEHTGEYRTIMTDYSRIIPPEEESLAYRYAFEMDADERKKTDALLERSYSYLEYVHRNYTEVYESADEFEDLAWLEALRKSPPYFDTAGFAMQHSMIMSIIDYLSENMVYSLSPKAPSPDRQYINAAETFLFDTKEGYCVQFATSAVLLLRSLGIPARYAEGYIADDYSRTSDDGPGRYSCTVRDYNAHAWIEVYFDYLGWFQYEVTAPYYSDMYESYTPTQSEPDTPPSYEPEVTDEITSEPVYEPTPVKKQPVQIPLGAIVSAAAAAAIIIAVIILRKRADIAAKRRDKLLKSAQDTSLTDSERLNCAGQLDTLLLRLLAINRLEPSCGEQQRDFAVRVDSKLGQLAKYSFAEVTEVMLAVEFGTQISRNDLARLTDYCGSLLSHTLRGANPFVRLWLEWFQLVK